METLRQHSDSFVFRRQGMEWKLTGIPLPAHMIATTASISIPAYEQYIARAQVTEAVNLLAALKTPAAEYCADTGSFEGITLDQVALVTQGKYVEDITQSIENPTTMSFTAKMRSQGASEQIAGKTLTLRSNDCGQAWECLSGDMPGKFLPESCVSLTAEDSSP